MTTSDHDGSARREIRRQAFLDGLRAGTPLLPSILPFGLMAGVAAREAGLDAFASLGMSVIIFAGASQLAAAQLLADGAVPLVIIATALIINLRLAMYSASISPYFSGLPRRWKWPLAYLLTDQAYAVCIGRFMYHPERPDRHWFYLGVALPVWLLWVIATLIGIGLGSTVPPAWHLGFAVPLIFLALLVPSVHDRPTLAAALCGGGVAVVAHGLPFNLGLISGAFAGIAAGLGLELAGERRA